MKHLSTSPLSLKDVGRKLKSISILATTALTITLSACSESEPDPGSSRSATSILLYAVASNNLHYDLHDDLSELCEGMNNARPSEADIWIYSLDLKAAPSLKHVVQLCDGSWEATTVKEYTRDEFSTDPARISQVIADYVALSSSDRRGIIFWSHATGWQPDFNDHVVPEDPENALPAPSSISVNYSYGADQYRGATDSCDILELNEAIPADTFDFIWFDCCYMSSIEVLYQLRDKASYIVAYPTEVAAEGMPYDLTIPHLARKDYDLKGAAAAMADYYINRSQVVTIAITDTSRLTEVAQQAEKAVGGSRPSMISLQKYSRSPNGPFYDFGQYTRLWGAERPDAGWDEAAFTEALDAAVVYKRASERDFRNQAIDPDNYSGISCHYFYDAETDASEYYKQLDWYKAVYTRFTE